MVSDSSLIVLGVITGAHGIRGEVKIKPFTQEDENLVAYGDLRDRHGKSYAVTIRSTAKGLIIAGIKGITDRNQAELLRGTELCVPRSALPDTHDDEYYIEDLVGMRVQLENGTDFGTVRRIDNFGAGDIIEIECMNKSIVNLAFIDAQFPHIDMKERIITHCPPEVIAASGND